MRDEELETSIRDDFFFFEMFCYNVSEAALEMESDWGTMLPLSPLI